MKFQKFCHVITQHMDDTDKSTILSMLYNDYHISINDKNYIVFRSAHFNYLNREHLITPCTFGSSYLLFLTKWKGQNAAFFIEKKIKDKFKYPRIYRVFYRFNDELYQGTLFNGELVKTNYQKWIYLISNLAVIKNKVCKLDIAKQIQKIHCLLTDSYHKDPEMEPCEIFVKKSFRS